MGQAAHGIHRPADTDILLAVGKRIPAFPNPVESSVSPLIDMNDDLVAEGRIFENASDTQLQVWQVIPGGDQNGKFIASSRLLMPECDHARSV